MVIFDHANHVLDLFEIRLLIQKRRVSLCKEMLWWNESPDIVLCHSRSLLLDILVVFSLWKYVCFLSCNRLHSDRLIKIVQDTVWTDRSAVFILVNYKNDFFIIIILFEEIDIMWETNRIWVILSDIFHELIDGLDSTEMRVIVLLRAFTVNSNLTSSKLA